MDLEEASVRITGGELRGRSLDGRVPEGVRPTGSRVREALFSVLGQNLAGMHVLELYAGSGILSFEALSRGALTATLVERDRRVAAWIVENAKSLGVEDRVTVKVGDALGSAPRTGTYELVLLDPPYGTDPRPILKALAPRVTDTLVIELPKTIDPPEVPGLELAQDRKYGRGRLAIYRPS